MLVASDKQTAILGLGVTGFSCGRYLAAQGTSFVGFDNNESAALAEQFGTEFPGLHLQQGDFSQTDFSEFEEILLSPGVPLATPSVAAAKRNGAKISSDISLFMQLVDCPVIAVTGSNGKSTVVSWVADALSQAGMTPGLGGNIGTSPLALLMDENDYDIYVLELSSFQLEIIDQLGATVACMLNLSPDHLDRYDNMLAYHAAKQRIYRGADSCVVNRDDNLTEPLLAAGMKVVRYGLAEPDLAQYGVRDGAIYKGWEQLIPVESISLAGKHNLLNALAALAICDAIGVDQSKVLESLRTFQGLPHRCFKVASIDGVDYINDSKATNVGATKAAVTGLAKGKNIVLLAGGLAKGADLSELTSISPLLKTVVIFGEAADALQDIFSELSTNRVASMAAAVQAAKAMAQSGDIVLLSPACASFDMFKSYQDRGEQFNHAVAALEASDVC